MRSKNDRAVISAQNYVFLVDRDDSSAFRRPSKSLINKAPHTVISKVTEIDRIDAQGSKKETLGCRSLDAFQERTFKRDAFAFFPKENRKIVDRP